MTKGETAKILAVLAASYPKFDVDDLKVQVWHEMLGDLDYKLVQVAVQKLILESPYPPAIADVRKQVVEIMQDPDDDIDAATAWGEVIRALNHYGYYRPEEALASMSPRTAKVVRMMGWQEICMSEEPSVIRGQFMKMYEIYTQREKQEALLPPNLKQTIRQIAEGRKLELIEGGRKALKG